jgi:hypothetical protein
MRVLSHFELQHLSRNELMVIPQAELTAPPEGSAQLRNAHVNLTKHSRGSLVELFAHPVLAGALAFRGGTALYKLYIRPPARYSEDIDLVQMRAEPAGPVMEAVRAVLDPWLGTPRWKQTAGRVNFVYRFQSEDVPPISMRLKVETNSREHFAVHGFKQIPFKVSSRWFNGECKFQPMNLTNCSAPKCVLFTNGRKAAISSILRPR